MNDNLAVQGASPITIPAVPISRPAGKISRHVDTRTADHNGEYAVTRFDFRKALPAVVTIVAVAVGAAALRELVAVRESVSGLRTEMKRLESTVSDLKKDVASRRGVIPLIARR
jgi:hypothetical protein